MSNDLRSVYERAGGDEPFRKLVDIFYRNVMADPRINYMFPADLEPGKKWQFLFITQYFGGPTRYIEERGHPRLRMRHMPFAIGTSERNAWAEAMLAAIDEVGFEPEIADIMRNYFTSTATFMMNRSDSDIPLGG
jgi:hemoglobin